MINNNLFGDYGDFNQARHIDSDKIDSTIEYIEFFYILNGIDLTFNKFKNMTLEDKLQFMKVNNRNNKINGLLDNE